MTSSPFSTCPVCGSNEVIAARRRSGLDFRDRRCATCGSVWRLPWSLFGSIVGIVLGSGLALSAAWFLLYALQKLIQGRMGAEDLLFAAVLVALVILGVRATLFAVASLRGPKDGYYLLRSGKPPQRPN
jgi:hypothetical protein